MRSRSSQMIDLTPWETQLRPITYPPHSTERDKEGFLLEVVHNLALQVISSLMGWKEKIESQCDNPDKWKENRASRCDHATKRTLQESKNWDTTYYEVHSTLVEDENNSRFEVDDPSHRKAWFTVFAVVIGFLSCAFRAIKSEIVTIGFKVTPENMESAPRILVTKLAKRLRVWHIIQGKLIRVNFISKGGIPVKRHTHTTISLILSPNQIENQESGKGPPYQALNPAFLGFISSDTSPSRYSTQRFSVPIVDTQALKK